MIFNKIVVVEITIPLIHGYTGNVVKGVPPLGEKINLIYRFGHNSRLKCGQWNGIVTLSHSIMISINKLFYISILRNEIPS